MDFSAAEYADRDADRLEQVLSGPPVTWVFLGDSITQGVTHTHGRRGFVEHFAERVRGELGRRSDAVVNSGVSGTTAQSPLAEFDWRAGRFAPDVVFVMFGTNDVVAGPDGVRAYRYRLDQIVQRTRDLGATVVLQTPPPVRAEGERTPQNLAQYVDAVRSLATDLGVVLVDHAAHWSADDAERTERAETAAGAGAGAVAGPADSWLDDAFHPNARGHLEMARTIFRTLGIDADDSAVCSLEIDGGVTAPA